MFPEQLHINTDYDLNMDQSKPVQGSSEVGGGVQQSCLSNSHPPSPHAGALPVQGSNAVKSLEAWQTAVLGSPPHCSKVPNLITSMKQSEIS